MVVKVLFFVNRFRYIYSISMLRRLDSKTIPLCKGEIIIFSDANAFYNVDAIKKIVRNFADKRVGCVSGRLIYRNIKL